MSSALAVLINGQDEERVSVLDRGLQYGDGLFTTLAVHEGTPLGLKAHLRRLVRDCRRLGLPPPPSCLPDEARQLAAGHRRAALKITLTRGQSASGYACPDELRPNRILTLLPWPVRPAHYAVEGVAVQFCRHRLAPQPALAGIKHLNRLDQVLARRELSTGIAEGLLLDQAGRVIEGTMSNVFLRRGSAWRTPDLGRCGVAGVVREQLLTHLEATRQAAEVGDVLPEEVETADEMFLCNSMIGVWPVRQLAGARFRDFSGSRLLAAWLAEEGAIAPG